MSVDWQQTLEDLKNVDLNDLASAPYSVKAVGVGLITILLAGLGYFFLMRGDMAKIQALRVQETALKQQFIQVKNEAINLPAYKVQMREMKVRFKQLLQQLPNTTHMPDFVTEVTQAGQACGLEIELLQPQAEKPRQFYAELPIKLAVAGSYAQLGRFVADIAALPRIVTLGDVTLKADKGGDRLSMSLMAKTYRYLKNPPPVKKK
ncbi:MAG: type 4a pilus biogenesis protein PilO [Gammaproteobacteria bacterium]|nr:type 4a pilus biogenesis protein PilO [Gammaproteobacteria bacterium]